MKRFFPALLMCAFAFVLAGPASAQYGQTKKSNATLAFEKAAEQAKLNVETFAAAEEGCAADNPEACFVLAEHHRKGLAGTQNYKLAAKAYKKACTGENAKGCAGLAYLTTHGRGVSSDLPKSRSLYEKSCDLGDVSGCAAFGNMVYTGTGGRKDTRAGTRHLKHACEAEYEWACDRLVRLGAQERDANVQGRLKDMRRRR
jgi:TPR repeat protein